MSVAFEQIENDFRKLRDFVLNDVERIVAMSVGGNYAAVAIIACGYEVLGELRGEQPQDAFARSLPESWRPVAPSLYDALRNGIVHGYETKRLHVGGVVVDIGVSWRERQHLSRDGSMVFVNIEAMAVELRQAFDDYEASLRSAPELRDRFITRRRKGREAILHSPPEIAAWRRLLNMSRD